MCVPFLGFLLARDNCSPFVTACLCWKGLPWGSKNNAAKFLQRWTVIIQHYRRTWLKAVWFAFLRFAAPCVDVDVAVRSTWKMRRREKKKSCIEERIASPLLLSVFSQNEAFSKPLQLARPISGLLWPSSLRLFAAHIYCIEDVDLCTFLHSCSGGVVPSSSVVVSFSVGNYNKAFP